MNFHYQKSLTQHPDIPKLSTIGTSLSPLLHENWSNLFTNEANTIQSIINEFGSPVHLISPTTVQENLSRFRKIISKHKIQSQVFYAMKASTTNTYVKSAINAGFGIDVASPHEMAVVRKLSKNNLAISISGPVKTNELLLQAQETEAIVSIDSLEELRNLCAIVRAKKSDKRIRIVIRIRPTFAISSRFGIDIEKISDVQNLLISHNIMIEFKGFHLHLSGYDVCDRCQAINEIVPIIQNFKSVGLKSSMLNIGGGFPVNYISGPAYEQFTEISHLNTQYYGSRPTSFYPYGGNRDLEGWFDAFFQYELDQGGTISSFLVNEKIELAVEPGRSALDQAAVSLFEVAIVKKDLDRSFVFLNGSSFSACETWFNSEYLVDPFIIKKRSARKNKIRVNEKYFLFGYSCLEDDVISKRPFTSDCSIMKGDILVFANTGGYQMDLLENNFHQYPHPPRVSIDLLHQTYQLEKTL